MVRTSSRGDMAVTDTTVARKIMAICVVVSAQFLLSSLSFSYFHNHNYVILHDILLCQYDYYEPFLKTATFFPLNQWLRESLTHEIIK